MTVEAAITDANDIPDDPRENYRQDNPDHGFDGHLPYVCGECAKLAPNRSLISPTTGDHWQTLQINWQEQCDIAFRAFDDEVAAHFPEHLPVGCQDCPDKPILPDKPIQPYERSIRQNARDAS